MEISIDEERWRLYCHYAVKDLPRFNSSDNHMVQDDRRPYPRFAWHVLSSTIACSGRTTTSPYIVVKDGLSTASGKTVAT